MGDADYFIIIGLMFINLITTSLLAFQSDRVGFELAVLAILIIIDAIYVFSRDLRSAGIFFLLSVINMVALFLAHPDFIFVLVAVIDALILIYLFSVHAMGKAPVAAVEEYGAMPQEEKSDSLFTELGLPTVEQISEPPVSVIYDEDEHLPAHHETLFSAKPKEEHAIMTNEEFEKKHVGGKQDGYVHIDSLDLPDAEEKELPARKYSYQLYHEMPRQTLEFQPIGYLEKRIERKVARQQARKRRSR